MAWRRWRRALLGPTSTRARGQGAHCKATPGRLPLGSPPAAPTPGADRPEPQERLGEVGPAHPVKARSWEGVVSARRPRRHGDRQPGTGRRRVPKAEGHQAGRPECSGSSVKSQAQDHRESRPSSSPEKPAGQGRSGQARDMSVLRLPDFLPCPRGTESAPGRLSFTRLRSAKA